METYQPSSLRLQIIEYTNASNYSPMKHYRLRQLKYFSTKTSALPVASHARHVIQRIYQTTNH